MISDITINIFQPGQCSLDFRHSLGSGVILPKENVLSGIGRGLISPGTAGNQAWANAAVEYMKENSD